MKLVGLIGTETMIPSNLKASVTVQANKISTLVISTTISLKKFQMIRFMISSPVSGAYTILKGSTLSAIIIGIF